MVEAILEAGAELFGELGYARTTTNKIAERAGVSVGSLYQYFASKDAILVSLLAQHHAEVEVVVGEALARLGDPATPLELGLRSFLTELVALHDKSPALTRALSVAVLRESPETEQKLRHGHHADQGNHVARLLAARPDVRRGDHELMAAVVGQVVGTLTRWAVHDPPPEACRDDLLEELVQLLVRYLHR